MPPCPPIFAPAQVRVEVGPKDLLSGTCVTARRDVQGELGLGLGLAAWRGMERGKHPAFPRDVERVLLSVSQYSVWSAARRSGDYQQCSTC